MKILILANNDVGLYQFRRELIEELLKEHSVSISLPYGELVGPLCKMGCQFVDTPIERRGINPKTDLKLYFQYRKMLQSEKPDLVITYTIKPNIYGGVACRLARIPYAVNITGLGTTFQNENLLKKLVVKMYKFSLKKAKVVFFENAENRQIFIDTGIAKEDKTCLLNGAGVNLEYYRVTEYPTGNKIKFLFIGRVMKEKGIDELFAAMKMLVDEGVDCSLDILGGYEEDYKAEIERYETEGWLHYHGYQKDVKPFIADCHCFVLPSWHEGMANTNLECAASGRPVITSNIHGCKEAVLNGTSGYLCEKKSSNNLNDKMREFCALTYDDRRNMGLAGRRHIEKHFDKVDVIQKTIAQLLM